MTTTNTDDNGLGKLTANDLAKLHAILLTVIDDGDPNDNVDRQHRWRLYEGVNSDSTVITSEDGANDQRLRFCAAVRSAIVAEVMPDAPKVSAGDKPTPLSSDAQADVQVRDRQCT